MANGYSGVIRDGGTFEEFAWRCARAIDHNLEMRDHPTASLLGRVADGHYLEQANRAQAKLVELRAMSVEQAAVLCAEEFSAQMRNWKSASDESAALRVRYEAMLVKAKAWVPPTEAHQRFKAFMINEIEDGIRHDCSSEEVPKPVLCDASAWLTEQICAQEESVTWHQVRHARTLESTAKTNEWNLALAKSLGTRG